MSSSVSGEFCQEFDEKGHCVKCRWRKDLCEDAKKAGWTCEDLQQPLPYILMCTDCDNVVAECICD